jgi:hypothetical protein
MIAGGCHCGALRYQAEGEALSRPDRYRAARVAGSARHSGDHICSVPWASGWARPRSAAVK